MTLLTRAPYWTGDRIWSALVATGVAFTLAAVLALVNKIQVRNKTEQIRQQFQRQTELEDQLRQSSKLEAVGRLAGGVAHDFNNLLTVICWSADLLLTKLPSGTQPADLARDIQQAGERAASLTRQLLTFSRRDSVRVTTLDLGRSVAETGQMLRRLIGERVELRIEPPVEPCWVCADEGLLSQILMNLSVNARDAMPEGGLLRIEIQPGPPRRLVIDDTGCGIPRETQDRIFEPFFTTKPVGQGTGLGLAVVYGAVKAIGGTISVRSEPGRGTRFIIELSAAEPPPGEPLGTPAPGDSPGAALTGRVTGSGESVLLVEDDDSVRAFACHVLAGQGYRLKACESPAAALALLDSGMPIDLLVTDVVMPGMSGRELAERVRRDHPAAAVLFISGYNEDEVLRAGVDSGQAVVLGKPFSPADLITRVREMLDRARAVQGPLPAQTRA